MLHVTADGGSSCNQFRLNCEIAIVGVGGYNIGVVHVRGYMIVLASGLYYICGL